MPNGMSADEVQETTSWNRRRVAALSAALLLLVTAIVFLARSRADAVTLALGASAETVRSLPMPVDTPPPLRPASGWPFQQLPLVAKFDIPLPPSHLPQFSRLTPTRSPAPLAVPAPGAPAAPGSIPPLWLLAPLAVGAGSGSAGAPGTVIPEPATLLLLSTGLALVGLKAKRRRPGGGGGARPRA